jgi:uncharacterized protein (TIGR03086 family)
MSSGVARGLTVDRHERSDAMPLDLGPAAQAMRTVVQGVDPAQLDAPTPCPDYTVAALLDHVDLLTTAFTDAARKQNLDTGGAGAPPGVAEHLDPEWQTKIPRNLDALAKAWREPDAWTGMTAAGSIEMPAEVAGAVAADELVVHAWDLARATGQELSADPAALEASLGFLTQFQVPGKVVEPGAVFGTVVETGDDASLLDRVIGFSGRDPAWTAT